MADGKLARAVAKHSEDFDRPTLIRVGAWGICALLSLVVMVVAARSELGTKRAAAAVAAITSPPRDATMTISQVLARTAESDREARRLSEIVRSLSADRDRIAMRIDGVEREMGDLTGSISKTISKPPGPMSAPVATPVPVAAPAPAVATPLPEISLPTMASPAKEMPKETPKQPSVSSASPPGLPIAGSPMLHAAAATPLDPKAARAGWPMIAAPETVATTEPASPPDAKSNPAPGTPAVVAEPERAATFAPTAQLIATENIPLPRPSPLAARKSAEAPSTETTASTDTKAADGKPEPQPTVTIGIDLGPALSMARLRSRWEAFRKAQGQVSDNMHPLVAIREVGQNKPVEMRLVVGPLADVAVAAQMCASLAGSQFPCQPAVYDGQRLALQ